MTSDQIALGAWVLARLRARGVDVARALRLADLSPALFADGRARLTTRQYFAFWDGVEQVVGGGGLSVGLELGSEAPTEQYDIASVAALHSADLAEALAKFARYKRLICPEAITVDVGGGEAVLRCRWLRAEGPTPTLLTDGVFARTLDFARRGLGRPVAPLRVELIRRPSREVALKRHFACPVRFDADEDRLVFSEGLLHEPFLTHNEELLAVLLPGLESALDAQADATTLADRVSALLQRELRGGKPSLESTAKALALSPRTLQRRLGQQATSYQRLLDRARQDAARRLLASTELDAGEIAFLLGFEELNSFARAFQGWEGTTPLRWREGARHGSDGTGIACV